MVDRRTGKLRRTNPQVTLDSDRRKNDSDLREIIEAEGKPTLAVLGIILVIAVMLISFLLTHYDNPQSTDEALKEMQRRVEIKARTE